MNILYLVTGAKEMISLQVKFSIKTILARKGAEDRVVVVTDSPEVYRDMEDVDIIPVDDRQIAVWKGPHNFFWRSKIMALRMIAERYPQDDLMYLDGDTALKGSLGDIKNSLTGGYGMMHVDEGCPGDMKGKSLRMYQQTEGRQYDGITISRDLHMWNAGVVAIPASRLTAVIDTALKVCDGMLDEYVEQITIEQYSISIALKERTKGLVPAKKVIAHYWHNKYEWCVWISRFFANSYVKARTQDDELEYIRKKNISGLERTLKIKRKLRKIHICL